MKRLTNFDNPPGYFLQRTRSDNFDPDNTNRKAACDPVK